jgi:hypothetical protein
VEDVSVFGSGELTRRQKRCCRILERGSRFVQLYDTTLDSPGGPGENLNRDFEKVCKDVDQASAALVLNLKERGMREDTLVIWGGEFGRTPMGERGKTVGRDHTVESFSRWMAVAASCKARAMKEALRLFHQKRIPSSSVLSGRLSMTAVDFLT